MVGTRLFIIDDDIRYCQDLELMLSGKFCFDMAHNGPEALEHLKSNHPDIILLDVDLGVGKMSGLEILENIRAMDDAPPVIMLSGNQEVVTVVEAIKMGAFHYATKQADLPQLLNLVEKALTSRDSSRALAAHRGEVVRLTGSFIAGDTSTHHMLDKIDRVAPTDATVLITGESGTGKEMVARRIHHCSDVSEGPFVAINCGAVPGEIIESEMFGHSRGAFTGADRQRVGKFEMASGGTLFLDEIGDSPMAFQVKLLRVLGERVFSRVGENSDIPVKTRIIAATSKDLEQAIEDGDFRPELYYRLNIYRIHLLPLNERPGDILPLADNFLQVAASRFRKDIHGFSDAVKKRLLSHEWVGNVRHLGNEVERAVLNCQGKVIGVGDIFQSSLSGSAQAETPGLYDDDKLIVTQKWQRDYLSARLELCGGNITEAAKASGMPRQSFQRLLKSLNIEAEDFRI